MKLTSLTSFETLNNESLEFVSGGTALVTSTTKDCKKRDVFN